MVYVAKNDFMLQVTLFLKSAHIYSVRTSTVLPRNLFIIFFYPRLWLLLEKFLMISVLRNILYA